MTGALAKYGFETHREHDGPIRSYQVIGERSSGTNFVSTLIKNNIDIKECSHLGWKHAPPHTQFLARNLLIIVSTRNPYDWVRSMYRKPWHTAAYLRGLEFSEFIRHEWETVTDEMLIRNDTMNIYKYENRARLLPLAVWNHGIRKGLSKLNADTRPLRLSDEMQRSTIGLPVQHDRHPITGKRFKNILELRTVKAQSFLGLKERGCNYIFVNYEHALKDPEAFIRNVADSFGLSLNNTYAPVTEWLGELPNTDKVKRKKSPVEISETDRQFINQNLSAEIEAAMGYDIN